MIGTTDEYLPTKDRNIKLESDTRDVKSDTMFEKGQSKRIWGELYKVVDSSDVIIQVLDARDPVGTRSRHIEEHLVRTPFIYSYFNFIVY